MTKLQQLEWFRRLGMPTPVFRALSYEDFQRKGAGPDGLVFPLAVRSTHAGEDGDEQSMAGHFRTELGVPADRLEEAVRAVFASYPSPEGQSVILQEMIEPDYAGVLFAFRHAVWKVEWVAGRGERLVSGQADPRTVLLPRFGRWDTHLVRTFRRWEEPVSQSAGIQPALVRLSYLAGRLLAASQAAHGLDIEFAVRRGRLFLLQARPLTTPGEAEEVLTSANHKEILPPYPSRLMTSVIAGAGEALFSYYRGLDATLPARRFIETAAGMPWINLSALLDTMVAWGLPTRLVCDSVGAEDPYRVGLRPYVAIGKLRVFGKVLRQQAGSRRAVRRWVQQWQKELPDQQRQRSALWEKQPEAAFQSWLGDFRRLYVELVTHMQALTGAMSGPVALLSRLGILERIAPQWREKSASTDYLLAYRDLEAGRISVADFLAAFGHRGFYESDIGRPRFHEYTAEEWQKLGISPLTTSPPHALTPASPASWAQNLLSILLQPVIRLIHTREWIRHESMRFFWDFRREMNKAAGKHLGADFAWWACREEDLARLLAGQGKAGGVDPEAYEEQSGWDLDTFLANREGRRLPLSVLSNVEGGSLRRPLGIYPGRVRGQVWRVKEASFANLERPDFPVVILVADALDPGFIPYFSQVDAVATYVGGLLSHASIVLREARIPSVTQLPPSLELRTGDWVELDGRKGDVVTG